MVVAVIVTVMPTVGDDKAVSFVLPLKSSDGGQRRVTCSTAVLYAVRQNNNTNNNAASLFRPGMRFYQKNNTRL